MSINTAHAAGGRGVVIFNGERILIFYDGCELNAKADTGVHPHFKGTKKGRAYLTSHRVIFVNKNPKDLLQSLSMPFTKMRQVDVKQPVFGPNRIEGNLLADSTTNGTGYGWDGSVFWSLTFMNGGAIEFGQALLEAGKRASNNAPTYVMPPPPPAGWYYGPPEPQHYYAAPPPSYASVYQDPYYSSFVPQHSSFAAPPYNEVYMMYAPPPYPGVQTAPSYNQGAPNYPQQQGAPNYSQQQGAPNYPQQQGAPNGNQGTAYYNGSNPHTVYASAPPAYQEKEAKKFD